MQVGDEFIRYTKHGAIQGRVKSISVKYKYDLTHNVKIQIRWILTELGESFEENSCYLVVEEITILDVIKLKKLFSKIKGYLGKK